MKIFKIIAPALIFSACLTCIAEDTNAQQTSNIKSSKSATPVITKGYYSIYRNAEKLRPAESKSQPAPIVTLPVPPQIRKGYYDIGKNREKIREQRAGERIDFLNTTGTGVSGKSPFGVVTKGYYSIGKNAEKLRK